MKKISMALAASALLLLSSCDKKTINNNQQPAAPQPGQKPEVRVNKGVLQFVSFDSYNIFLHMPVPEKLEFCKYLESLPGFTSNNEAMAAAGGVLKTSTECNCDIDDEIIGSIVNDDYIVLIENFRVKLDACTEHVYVSDELAPGAEYRAGALAECDYSSNDLYIFTFKDVVEAELPFIRDSLNGNPPQERCKQVAISNRAASKASSALPTQTHPYFELKYMNLGISGRVRALMTATDANVDNNGSWEFKFLERHYKLRCDQTVNDGAGITSKTLSGNNYKYLVHHGTRLTNYEVGVDAYMIKLQLRITKNTVEESEPIQIVP